MSRHWNVANGRAAAPLANVCKTGVSDFQEPTTLKRRPDRGRRRPVVGSPRALPVEL